MPRSRYLRLLLAALVALLAYLLLWPVPIEPVAWSAPRGGAHRGAAAR